MVIQKLFFNDCFVLSDGQVFLEKYNLRKVLMRETIIILMYKNNPIKHPYIPDIYFDE